MKGSHFDNLPYLDKAEALKILSTPIEKLERSSDYYKAVFHLRKFPGAQTEKALLALLESSQGSQAVVIARRRAVESLADLGCINAIPAIGRCLLSDDPNLVENAAWALQELGCQDAELHKKIARLLQDPGQNRRVLIQSLARMGAVAEVSHIERFLRDSSSSSGVRGASIAAVAKLSGERNHIHQLKEFLSLPNQNDRQCAVQDVIDSGAIDLIPAVISTPVALSFRLRAIDALWPKEIDGRIETELLKKLDCLLWDKPNTLNLLNMYDKKQNPEFLINELFGTDFARAYLALSTLIELEANEIWTYLSLYLEKAKKDYGAIYFFLILFRSIDGWSDSALKEIELFIFAALSESWPHYMKFRPAAILTLLRINSNQCRIYISQWLDQGKTPFWAARYAALMSFEILVIRGEIDPLSALELIRKSEDTHKLVRQKLKLISIKIREV